MITYEISISTKNQKKEIEKFVYNLKNWKILIDKMEKINYYKRSEKS